MTTERTRRSGTSTALLAVGLYALVAAAVLGWVDGLPAAVRVPLALPLLIFAPGYAVVTALFPTTGPTGTEADDEERLPERRAQAGLSPVERGVLAVVASVAVVPMVALVAAVTVGVVLAPILAGVAGVTVVAAAVGLVRSPGAGAVPEAPRDAGPDVDWTARLSDTVTLLAVGVAAVLLVASAAVAFVGSPDGGPGTEFYLAGGPTDGDDPAYDLRIDHEADDRQRYTVVVAAASAGDLTELDRFSTTVGPGETASETYSLDPDAVESDEELLFLLYEGDAPATPDRDGAHRVLELSDVPSEDAASSSVTAPAVDLHGPSISAASGPTAAVRPGATA